MDPLSTLRSVAVVALAIGFTLAACDGRNSHGSAAMKPVVESAQMIRIRALAAEEAASAARATAQELSASDVDVFVKVALDAAFERLPTDDRLAAARAAGRIWSNRTAALREVGATPSMSVADCSRIETALESAMGAATDTVTWEEMQQPRTGKALLSFLASARLERLKGLARKELLHTLFDSDVFVRAAQVGTEEALREFLVNYPAHSKQDEAFRLLSGSSAIGRLDALAKRRLLDVEVIGGGITQARLRMRKLTEGPLQVVIPVGTLFRPGSAGVQSMVSTGEISEVLENSEWQTLDAPVACANRPLTVPGRTIKLNPEALPRSHELTRAVQAVTLFSDSIEVRQAAVWIITDNSNFAELGALGGRRAGDPGRGGRLISADDAALALKLMQDAGVSTQGRRIWQSRLYMIGEVRDPTLRQWLQQARPL